MRLAILAPLLLLVALRGDDEMAAGEEEVTAAEAKGSCAATICNGCVRIARKHQYKTPIAIETYHTHSRSYNDMQAVWH